VTTLPLSSQLINLGAAVLLLTSFAMLSQRRIVSLVNLFAIQGAALSASTAIVAFTSGQHHLYYSAALSVALKVLLLPWILHRLIRRLNVRVFSAEDRAAPLAEIDGFAGEDVQP